MWARHAEWFRIIAYPMLLVLMTFNNGWPSSYYILAVAYLALSIPWFMATQRSYVPA
jgi:hypothetical protein